jgi:hypothetical protein
MLSQHFKDTLKWESLDNAYVNFTHFAPVKSGPGGTAFTKLGFYGSWERQCAYYLKKENFPHIDIVLPMAFPLAGYITEESLAYIVISVKNCDGTEHIDLPYLTRKSIEGVLQKKKKSKKSQDSEPSENDMYITACNKSIVNLTLHSLTFINPEGTIGEMERPDSTWIETNAQKPYIAFVMSMGKTDRADKLFIAEENVYSIHITQVLMF